MVRARMRAPGVGAGTARTSGLGVAAIGDGTGAPADLAAEPAEPDNGAGGAVAEASGSRGGAVDTATNATGGSSGGGDRAAGDGGGSDTMGGGPTSAGATGNGGCARAAALRRAFLRFTSAAAIVGSTGKMVVDSGV